MWTELAKMVIAVQGGQDRRLKSLFLTKKDDPVTYQLMFGNMPLKSTYIQLQMADQTFRKVEGIVTDVRVKIDDHFVHIDF